MDFTILIADRNSHVRDYLRRELTAEGIQVVLAESGQEILTRSFGPYPVDLLIFDPNLPDMDPNILLLKLNNRIPPLPVIIHSLPGEEQSQNDRKGLIVYIEKGGQSVERLKNIITKIQSGENISSTQ
jgi:DNA-binding NtrC family response regulator